MTDKTPQSDERQPINGLLLNWLRLMRVSNLPTAISNILLGFLIANGSWSPASQLLLLIAASCLLYSAGMILNDVFDLETDRKLRPDRPLPRGLIDWKVARFIGFCMLVAAVAIAFFVSARSGFVASILALSVFLYDFVLKKTLVAPLAMGLCRTLNVLLGASFMLELPAASFYGFPALAVWVAISIGVAISGITWIARNEADAELRPRATVQASLIFGTILLIAGLAGLAFAGMSPGIQQANQFTQLFPFLILLVSITIIRRAITAVWTCDSKVIQGTVIAYLRSLIIFDAAVCLLVAPAEIHFALIVVSLLIPSLLLSRWIKQT